MSKKLKPITPGDILSTEFIEPLKVSQNKLARDIDVPVGRINDILHGRRAITADTALRFAIYFGTSAEFWLNLQYSYELKLVKQKLLPGLKKEIRKFKKVA